MAALQAVWAFLMAHQAVLAGAVVAVLDLAYALNDKLQANGILHQIYLFAKKLLGQSAS